MRALWGARRAEVVIAAAGWSLEGSLDEAAWGPATGTSAKR